MDNELFISWAKELQSIAQADCFTEKMSLIKNAMKR